MAYDSNRSSGQHAQRAQMMSRPNRLELHEEDNGSGEWGEEDFNLLEYIGKDLTPVVDAQGYPFEEPLEDDDGVRKENREEYLYQTEQIQQALYSDYSHHEGMISPGMDPMLNGGDALAGDSNDSVFNEIPPSAGFEQQTQQVSVPSSSSTLQSSIVVGGDRLQTGRHSHHQHHRQYNTPKSNTPTMVTSSSRAPLMASTSSNGQRVIKVVKSETPAMIYVSSTREPSPLDDNWFGGALVGDVLDFQQQHQAGAHEDALVALQQLPQQCVGGGPMRVGVGEQPRKYRIKSENERRNPVYRQKREKNNDAVRRSRNKAKEVQEQRDERLNLLERENGEKDKEIRGLKSQLATTNKVMEQLLAKNKSMEKELTQNLKLMANCTCRSRGSRSSTNSISNHR